MIQKRPVVLVVDDEPAITEMLEMLLEEDYEVNICLYPLKAVQQAHFVKPDLLIVDLMMPALNGIDLLHRMRHDPELIQVPAILMTASTSLRQVGINEDELDYLKASILLKPFDNNKLINLMKKLYQPHHPNSLYTRS